MKIQIFMFSIICFSLFSCGENTENSHNQSEISSKVFITSPINNSSLMDTILVRCDSIKNLEIRRLDLYVDGDSILSTSVSPYVFPLVTNNFNNGLHSIYVKAIYGSESVYQSNQIIININNFLVFSNGFGQENKHEEGLSILQNNDSSFTILGNTGENLLLLKTDRYGNELWTQYFGGSKIDNMKHLIKASDGGYFISGSSESYGPGESDIWIIKASSSGLIEWNKNFGTFRNEYGGNLLETDDGSLFLIGNGDLNNSGDQDIWLIKTNSQGDSLWSKIYGGSGDETGNDIISVGDSSYIIIGSTSSFGNGGADIFIIKIDKNGNEEWNLNYGGTSDEFGRSIIHTPDDGFVILSSIESYGIGNNAVNIIRTNSSGEIIWDKTFGGGDGIRGSNSLHKTIDGNFILTYNTYNHVKDGYDAWLVKINDGGFIDWGRKFDNEGGDLGFSCLQTLDGGYVVTGSTFNLGYGEKDFGDLWLLKTDDKGIISLPQN